ncbi:MAG: hypothetical protein ACKO5F_06985 [Synechococcus sp.]
MSSSHPYVFNGEEPAIVGRRCRAFHLLQHQSKGSISDPANVAFFQFDTTWVRLYFEADTIFWRPSEPPEPPVNDGLTSQLVLVNLAALDEVVGQTLERLEYWGTDTEIGASLAFAPGAKLLFRHRPLEDRTLVELLGSAAKT